SFHLQAEKRREKEESLRRFQDEVRHRVAQRAQVFKKRQQPHTHPVVKITSLNLTKCYILFISTIFQWSGGMRQVRLRLAACRMIPHEETTSELPGGRWNISPTRHVSVCCLTLVPLFKTHSSYESCTFRTEKTGRRQMYCVHEAVTSLVPILSDNVSQIEHLSLQRQSQFLMHRRLVMSNEREQVKENKQHRKHLKRTARIKAEKEQIRLEEERRLERDRQLAEARQKLEERELLILERLKLEEEERAVELQRRKREDKGKVAARFIDALRAQMKERLSQAKLDLPPLCCCASSFWDSHPDTCANNCVFHNNPKGNDCT
uniref:Coiled-coil domain containing 15 n=1 Tax=Stegastes partitus TaxID=144197 RepID=A0A3B5B8G9_9TELE